MQEDLQYLLQLSAVDKKVYELKQTRKDLPQRIQSLKDAIGREKATVDRLSAEITKTQDLIRQSQDAVAEETQALQDSGKRLDNISTNREYDAVHLEIAAHKKNIDTAQAQGLHFQQVLENLQKDLETSEAEYLKAREEHEPELEKLTEELNGIEDRIAEEATKGDAPRAKIGKKVLSVYDRTLQRRGTPNIIAAVNHVHRQCDVCARNQTPQRLIEISKKRSLLTCEGCGSLLVWREDDVPAL